MRGSGLATAHALLRGVYRAVRAGEGWPDDVPLPGEP
jgi:hypothetical protein